jgi:hypothetical protein
MALSFDLLTALTVTGILAILSIYVIVVYKKGWLKRESKADQAYYLCPNQKCKRVFRKPVWLTDLAKNPPESYQACPHCGVSIRMSSLPSLQTKPLPETQPRPAATHEMRGRGDGLRSTKREESHVRLEPSEEFHGPNRQVNTPHDAARPEVSRTQRSFFHFPHTKRETQGSQLEPLGKNTAKGSQTPSKKCSHFFGYVKTLPKNTPIPDECLWCPSIVDCLSHEQEVKAEA